MKYKERYLDEIAKFSQGIQVGIEKQYNKKSNGLVRFLRIVDYTQGGDDIRYIDMPSKNHMVSKEDIVMVRYGASAGFIGTGLEGIIANNMFKIEPNEHIDKKFLYYFLTQKRIKDFLLNKTTASAMPAINFGMLSEIAVPIIELDTQKKIVEVLDKAQELIDKRREQIEALDELVKSRFIDMFGDPGRNAMNWEKRTLNDISLRKGEYGSGASAIDYLSGYPRYIRITDINDNGKLNDNKVTVENLSEYEKYKLNDGDILFARTGATVGKTYRYKKSDGECLFAGYLIRFTPNLNIINPDFLFAFTKTSFYKSWVDAKQNTVAQPNINAKQYGEELEVILPPMELQNKFADFVKQVDKLKSQMETSLKELEDNFNSLMQKAFKGELF